MSRAPAVSSPILAESDRGDPRLAALLTDLDQLRFRCRVLTEWIGGDADHRLQVWREPGEVTVELLWCGPGDPAPTGLHAVRICGQRREVWCSPGSRGTVAETVRFIADLLVCDENALPHHYVRLG